MAPKKSAAKKTWIKPPLSDTELTNRGVTTDGDYRGGEFVLRFHYGVHSLLVHFREVSNISGGFSPNATVHVRSLPDECHFSERRVYVITPMMIDKPLEPMKLTDMRQDIIDALKRWWKEGTCKSEPDTRRVMVSCVELKMTNM